MINKLKKITLAAFIVYIFLVIFATLSWNYRPTLYTNTKYETDIDIKQLNENALYVCQHKTGFTMYEQMILCEECNKSNIKFNIVSASDNKFYEEFFKNLPIITSYELVKLNTNIKSNKTKTLINKLKNKENVLIFLNKEYKNKGVYYILKETRKPLILVNLKDNNPDKIFNKNVELSYKQIDDYPIEKEPEDFMFWLKDKLLL